MLECLDGPVECWQFCFRLWNLDQCTVVQAVLYSLTLHMQAGRGGGSTPTFLNIRQGGGDYPSPLAETLLYVKGTFFPGPEGEQRPY